MSNWGKGVINNIGWGQGANNDIGWGSVYNKSNAGETLLKSDLNIDAFIIEVDTTKAGTPSDQFQFTGALGDYDVIAKQNGTQVANFNDLSGAETITLPSSGVYNLEVKSKEVNGFNRIRFNNGGDKLKITDIKQWGTIVWPSFLSAFWGCENMLVTATDIPNLSSVTAMYAMFFDSNLVNPDTSNWDVSSVTDMRRMFQGATSANPDTSNWDVSNVTDMRYMFLRATSSNPDVSNWDVSNVTNMRYMFRNATSANPDVSNWDVSSVTDMDSMLENSNLSEENLTAIYENWSQLNLKQNVSFSAGTTEYNTSGQAGRDILVNTYNWIIEDGGQVYQPFIIEVDTSKDGTPSDDNQFQFTGAEGDYDVVAKQGGSVVQTFNDLSNQETITLPSSGVYNLEVKSKEVNGFNRIQFNDGGDKLKITDIKQWGDVVWSSFERAFFRCSNMLTTATDVPNLSSVTDMSFMFNNTTLANPDTTNWDVSNVTDMRFMFFNASSANPDVSNWDVSNVTDMRYMFFAASSANPDTSNWDVSNVTDMRYMFFAASSANPDTSNWDVSSVTTMANMFQGATSANPDTTNWNVSNVNSMYAMFTNASSANPDTSLWDVSSVADMRYMFQNSNLSVENLTSIYENWSQLSLQQNVSFSAGNTKYNASGQTGRDILVNTYNWTITDGGQV